MRRPDWLPDYIKDEDLDKILIFKDNKKKLYDYLYENHFIDFEGLIRKDLLQEDCLDWTDMIFNGSKGYLYKSDIALTVNKAYVFWTGKTIHKMQSDLKSLIEGLKS